MTSAESTVAATLSALDGPFDLLVVGGLGVDIVARVPALPPPLADSIGVPPIDLRIGNTGAGVALAARALGLNVAVIDTLGDDAPGAVVRAALARHRIPALLLHDPRGTRRSVNMVDPEGRRMSLYDPRGPWTGESFPALGALAAAARHTHVSIMDWVVPSLGLLTGPVSTDLHDWDGVNDYHRPFLAAADLALVSAARLGERADEVLAGMLRQVSTAIVTDGARGARLARRGLPPVRVPAADPPGPVLDTNGAGDAFLAGFVAARLSGADDLTAAARAARVAAVAITYPDMEYGTLG